MTKTSRVLIYTVLTLGALTGLQRQARAVDGGKKTVHIYLGCSGCDGCADVIVTRLKKQAGVYDARTDKRVTQVEVTFDAAKTNARVLIEALEALGYDASLSPISAPGHRMNEPPFPAGADWQEIVKAGEDTSIHDHLAKGKITFVDFWAPWCVPCKQVKKILGRAATHKGIAVRTINVVDWKSPVAKHYLSDVKALPHVRIYDRKGKLIAKLSGDDWATLPEWIRRVKGR